MKKIIYFIFAASLVIIIATSGIQSSAGKAGKTKSPGETSCASAGCHDAFAENSGGGSIYITSDIPTTGYVPGTTYHLSVTIAQTGDSLFGFGLEALKIGDVNAGSLIITDTSKTKILSATINNTSRANVVQKKNGGLNLDSAVFSFDWVAPSADSGIVTFYFSGIAANNDGGKAGDHVYYSSNAVSPAVGIAEKTSNENSFYVYPNPASDNITVNFSTNENSFVKITLNDINGRLINTFSAKDFSKGNHIERFYLPKNITKGVYFLNIDINGKKLVSKINVL